MLEQAGYKVLAGLCAAVASFAAVYQVRSSATGAKGCHVRSTLKPSHSTAPISDRRAKALSAVQILAHLRNYNGPVFQVTTFSQLLLLQGFAELLPLCCWWGTLFLVGDQLTGAAGV